MAAVCFAPGAQGASVSVNGYTNDFNALPAAADWSYFNITGAKDTINTIADMDAAVQAVPAASIVTQVTSDTTINPPAANASGTWSGLGFFLETRPTGNAATLLMCTLVNNIGSPPAA